MGYQGGKIFQFGDSVPFWLTEDWWQVGDLSWLHIYAQLPC